jgi:hypothetical protein
VLDREARRFMLDVIDKKPEPEVSEVLEAMYDGRACEHDTLLWEYMHRNLALKFLRMENDRHNSCDKKIYFASYFFNPRRMGPSKGGIYFESRLKFDGFRPLDEHFKKVSFGETKFSANFPSSNLFAVF